MSYAPGSRLASRSPADIRRLGVPCGADRSRIRPARDTDTRPTWSTGGRPGRWTGRRQRPGPDRAFGPARRSGPLPRAPRRLQRRARRHSPPPGGDRRVRFEDPRASSDAARLHAPGLLHRSQVSRALSPPRPGQHEHRMDAAGARANHHRQPARRKKRGIWRAQSPVLPIQRSDGTIALRLIPNGVGHDDAIVADRLSMIAYGRQFVGTASMIPIQTTW